MSSTQQVLPCWPGHVLLITELIALRQLKVNFTIPLFRGLIVREKKSVPQKELSWSYGLTHSQYKYYQIQGTAGSSV